jgi:hypothetical protein
MTNQEMLRTDFIALKTALNIGACYSRISITKLDRCIIVRRNSLRSASHWIDQVAEMTTHIDSI